MRFKRIKDSKTGKTAVFTNLTGKEILTKPLLNKSSAFTLEERIKFKIKGKLPNQVETLEQQVKRAKLQLDFINSPLSKYIYLISLMNTNEVLFYKLLETHIDELMPIIYTPTVAEATKKFSLEHRQSRGLYIGHDDIDNLEEILDNRTHDDVKMIVITDGEAVLGIGDQGIGGIKICISKLALYSVCGLHPSHTLPIVLDCGTNNSTLLNDDFYLGKKTTRLKLEELTEFYDRLIKTINKIFPYAVIHWEDMGKFNAQYLLDRYQYQYPIFNDDIQGTAVVTMAALLNALKIAKTKLEDHKIFIYGAGGAGLGIADIIVKAFIKQGLNKKDILKQFWLFDRNGVVRIDNSCISELQKPFARSKNEIKFSDLTEAVKAIKPTILIGTSTAARVFSQEIVEFMSSYNASPIIFPLSNPTANAEAAPADIIKWSNNKALVATGSPFAPVEFENKIYKISQCNNALAFPGIGIAMIIAEAKHLTDEMLWAATQTLADLVDDESLKNKCLLPRISNNQEITKKVAYAVVKQAIKEGISNNENLKNGDFDKIFNDFFWEIGYPDIHLS